MKLVPISGGVALVKEREEIGRCLLRPTAQGAALAALCVAPAWRRRGYGSYLLKEILRAHGGYARDEASVFTAPLPEDPGETAFWAKFGFAAEDGQLVRRRQPDLTAVQLVHDWLAARLPAPRFCIDATCGNGGDTAFLCRLVGEHGHVLALDVQPQAIASTRARLRAAGVDEARYTLVCDDHARLMSYAAPGSADAVLFNFGWLPGAQHDVFSTAASSLPALEAALAALRPDGVLSAVLYSGRVIGTDEKQAVLAWLRGLPIEKYTVLICEFGNWADTAPLPCFVIKK